MCRPAVRATVTVDDPGGFAADDSRHLVLDPAASARITVIVADPTALRGGLYVRAGARGRERRPGLRRHRGRRPRDVGLDARTSWTREHALVILGTRTLERGGRELVARYLARGGSVLLSLGPEVDPGTLGERHWRRVGVSRPSPRRSATPAPRSCSATRVTPSSGCSPSPPRRWATSRSSAIVRWTRAAGRCWRASPAARRRCSSVPRERGRLLLFTSDLDNQWNRFPLSPAFVPFVIESARYLTEGRRETQAWVLPATPPGLGPVPGIFTIPDAGGRQTAGSP